MTDIHMNASHAACVRVEYQGADGGIEDVDIIGGLFRLLLSGPTAGLQVLCCLHEWEQGRELSGLWATSGRLARPPRPRAIAPAPAAVKAAESTPQAPVARLKFESDDEGRARRQKRPRQLNPSFPL